MTIRTLPGALLMAALALLIGPARAGPDASANYVTLSSDGPVDAVRLHHAIEPLFDETAGTTQSLLVMRRGEVIAERYGDGIGPDTLLLSRSIAKSVTAVLVGLMVSDGRLALDSPVPLRAWEQPGDPRGTITLRQLLTMESGLEHREAGEPLATADTVRMLFTDGADDMAAYAEAKPVAARPGSAFVYSTANYMIVSDLMTRMLSPSENPRIRRDAMDQFIAGRLADPLGLSSLTPEYDASGTVIGGAMMYMTTRDYAKFGEFLRNRGRVDGRQILSARWISFMRRAAEHEPAYGGGIWLNREGTAESPLFPNRAHASLFACVGRNGQYIIVSPEQDLVIVRMGLSEEGEEKQALRNALADLIGLFPTS